MSDWVTLTSLDNVPAHPACYVLYRDGKLIYIGSTRSLAHRLPGHQHIRKNDPFKVTVKYKKIINRRKRIIFERNFIRRIKPPFNIVFAKQRIPRAPILKPINKPQISCALTMEELNKYPSANRAAIAYWGRWNIPASYSYKWLKDVYKSNNWEWPLKWTHLGKRIIKLTQQITKLSSEMPKPCGPRQPSGKVR